MFLWSAALALWTIAVRFYLGSCEYPKATGNLLPDALCIRQLVNPLDLHPGDTGRFTCGYQSCIVNHAIPLYLVPKYTPLTIRVNDCSINPLYYTALFVIIPLVLRR